MLSFRKLKLTGESASAGANTLRVVSLVEWELRVSEMRVSGWTQDKEKERSEEHDAKPK